MSADTDTDKRSLYSDLKEFFGKKAEEVDEQTDEDTGQKADDDPEDDPGDDSAQKADEGEEETVTEDLIVALAEDMDVPVEQLREAVASVGQSADDEPDPDDDEDEEDDEADPDMKADDGTDASVSIDFGAKLEEHDVVTQDDLESLRETIVEDVGEKLAETNEEAVEEIAQKMQAGETPNPAGGSFQDEQDFESHLSEISEQEGW